MRPLNIMSKFVLLVAAAISFAAASVASAAPISPKTSIDLYCETMITATIETSLRMRTTQPSKEKLKKIAEMESEMLALCKATPAVGEAKLQSKMTAQEFRIVSCLAMAEGITNVYKSGYEPVSKLSERRTFAANACASNGNKAFLNDLNKFGPDYVLGRQY